MDAGLAGFVLLRGRVVDHIRRPFQVLQKETTLLCLLIFARLGTTFERRHSFAVEIVGETFAHAPLVVGAPRGGCQRGLVLLSGWGGPVVGELSIVEIQGRVILASLGASARPPAVRSSLSSDVVAVA